MQWVLYNPLPTRKDGSSIASEETVPQDKINLIRDPTSRHNAYFNYSGNTRYFEMSPVLPLGLLLIISTVIFVSVIFRRWPGLIAGIIAGTLTSVAIYLTLIALREPKMVYE